MFAISYLRKIEEEKKRFSNMSYYFLITCVEREASYTQIITRPLYQKNKIIITRPLFYKNPTTLCSCSTWLLVLPARGRHLIWIWYNSIDWLMWKFCVNLKIISGYFLLSWFINIYENLINTTFLHIKLYEIIHFFYTYETGNWTPDHMYA